MAAAFERAHVAGGMFTALMYRRPSHPDLERWAERVRSMFDEKFVRMWRLYLAGSVAGFTTGSLQLFQVVFAPGESNDIPWTRAHLYTS